MRRGAHARHVWRISQQIARQQALPLPYRIQLATSRFLADGLATLRSDKAEETVVIARRPAGAE